MVHNHKENRHRFHQPLLPKSLSSDRVLSIHEDQKDIIWIGTNGGGLSRFDPQSETIHTYTTKNGLPNNVVYGILGDEKGNLWLSTNNGLCKFNPRKENFLNYDMSDGLQSREFNTCAYYKSPSGEMFFGGIKGLNAFFPNEIRADPYKPQIVVIDFRIFNKSIPVGEYADGRTTLSKSITETSLIKLPYNYNHLSFEFAALHYAAPEKNRYAYRGCFAGK